jgi:hypothetical protein
MAQVGKSLPSKYKALSLSPSAIKNPQTHTKVSSKANTWKYSFHSMELLSNYKVMRLSKSSQIKQNIYKVLSSKVITLESNKSFH